MFIGFALLRKEVLALMVVSHEEASLILQVKVWGKAVGGELAYNLLFQPFMENLAALVQFLAVMN